ncbi:MAG TPA: tetratricopeptide repeat protein [Candidatus Baltobacteraceae bacterium]|nr:tetratricopeptide repeat protein [Candidatus Baltobacteraceae bacterium]
MSLLDRGDFAAAEPLLTTEIENAPDARKRAFYLNKRGVARIKLGRRDDARDDFEGALQCVRRYAPALTNIGNLLLEEGRVDEAISAYGDAIEADGEYAVAYVNLASAYKRAGRLDEAVRALHTGLRLEGRKRARPREGL